MTTTLRRKPVTALLVTGILAATLTACGGDGDKASDTAGRATTAAADASAATPAPAVDSPADQAMAAEPFGAACAAVPKDGAGSFAGMAADPVATAASHNPLLSTLVTAVQKAGLVDTLNSAKDITVFAPTNDAFAKLPKKDLDAVLADKDKLTKILTYHVVPRRLAPAALAGAHKTLETNEVTATGTTPDFTVNGSAKVLCGNVQTANATVYIVDTVLMPAS
ncbi:fasciclin domain-containing protein [Kitasatospora sp. A2-31]|uniref:fasciclin domain-containing protein n=1 Tax=Kitasatospora sp. A2-31 TaxID=2916414 RepID=UPI001EEF7272|nr:fasciclin domain-containing protein [Kitasatospora sp. A2-31]MCG6499937.1 fasciclin domain-containing protein [Kitasatospora sp. A2-31]